MNAPQTPRPKIYLAGPDVFFPDPLTTGMEKKELCRRYGFQGVFPLDAATDGKNLIKRDEGFRISRNNEELIRACDLLIANMTPFRGPSMDVGTAFELGFARALGKPVLGYTNDTRTFKDRLLASAGGIVRKADGSFADSHGIEIEDFDLADNLMIDGAIHLSTGTRVVVPGTPCKNYYTDLSVFEQCLVLAKSLC